LASRAAAIAARHGASAARSARAAASSAARTRGVENAPAAHRPGTSGPPPPGVFVAISRYGICEGCTGARSSTGTVAGRAATSGGRYKPSFIAATSSRPRRACVLTCRSFTQLAAE
jgi:hypothetical protein